MTTIQFTQEQVRDIALVSPGDVRQWRKAVPYLAAKAGKAARFAFSDLVALTIVRELTGTLGVRISEVGAGVDALFRALSESRPSHLEGVVAIVGRESAHLVAAADLAARHVAGPAFVAPCDPLLIAISARMLPISPGSSQTALPFPPRVVGAGA